MFMLESRCDLERQEAKPSQGLGSHCIIVQKPAISRSSACPSASTAEREALCLGVLEQLLIMQL